MKILIKLYQNYRLKLKNLKKYVLPTPKTDLKWFERDLDSWITKVKFKEVTDNPTHNFHKLKLLNFDIIYNDIYKRKLEKPI